MAFETVREAVVRDFDEERRRTANPEFLARLQERYQVSWTRPRSRKQPLRHANSATMKRWLAIFGLFAAAASAHEVRPAFLELTERAPGEFDVLWKVPARGRRAAGGRGNAASAGDHEGRCGCDDDDAVRLSGADGGAAFARRSRRFIPSLPKDAVIVVPPRVERIFGAEIKRWTISTGAKGLEGWEVAVHGLQSTMVDVLVRIALADGRVVSHLLRPDAPSFVFHANDAGPAAGGYFILGVEHILFGIDHLLFVLALVLIVRGVGLLVKTITAFTVAHSITLALATLGVVHVPVGAGRGGHCAEHRFRRVGNSAQPARRARADRARAMAGRGNVWIAARVRLRGRAERGRLAGERHPARAALFQSRRRGRPARVCRCRRSASSRCCGASGCRNGRRSFRPTPSAASPCFGSSNAPPPFGETTFSHSNSALIHTMKTKALVTTIATLLAISFTAFAADETASTDLGTLDKEKAGEAFKKRPYSPYADRKFPTRPFFGDTHLHTGVLDGCRRVRLPFESARRLSLRARRAGHGLERPAREALAPARFPRRRRSLGQHGLLHRFHRGQARTARRSDGAQVV